MPAGEEVNLLDYVKIIIKRKTTILAAVFLAVAIAAAVTFSLPKIYKIDTAIEIGRYDGVEGWEQKVIEDPLQLKGKIDNDVSGFIVREKLKISENEYPKIKTDNPKGTNLITIKIESDNVEQAKNILEETNSLIIADHREKIKMQKELLEKNIKTIEEKIKLSKSDIENTKNKIAPLDSDMERISNKIKYIEEEKNNLEAKVEALQKILPYEQDPGTQFALFDTKEKLAGKKQEIEGLYMDINSLKAKKEDFDIQISKLQGDIENFNAGIDSLQAVKDYIKETKVIKIPVVSEKAVSSRPVLNIAIAAVLGLFMGIFTAFGKEWWENNKKNL